MKCTKCSGSGQFLGNGFMLVDCHLCNASGYLPDAKNDALVPVKANNVSSINRRSKHYRDAINELMTQDKTLSREDAVKLFEKAYNE